MRPPSGSATTPATSSPMAGRWIGPSAVRKVRQASGSGIASPRPMSQASALTTSRSPSRKAKRLAFHWPSMPSGRFDSTKAGSRSWTYRYVSSQAAQSEILPLRVATSTPSVSRTRPTSRVTSSCSVSVKSARITARETR